MKIAVLADIHGNIMALNAVLKRAESQGITKFIIAGDHISDCPAPLEVIDTLRSLDACIIRGNREQYIIDYTASGKNSWQKHDQMSSIEWTRSRLRESDFEWIEQLDEQATLDFNDKDSIRVVHGSTEHISELLFEDKADRIKEIVSGIDEQVMVCGHSHLPWSSSIDGKLVVNPGSVGVAFNSSVSAEYAVLEWDGTKWNATHHLAPYSYEKLYKSFLDTNFYVDGGVWAKLVLQSIKDGKNRNQEFMTRALTKHKMDTGKKGGYISNEIWYKVAKSWVF